MKKVATKKTDLVKHGAFPGVLGQAVSSWRKKRFLTQYLAKFVVVLLPVHAIIFGCKSGNSDVCVVEINTGAALFPASSYLVGVNRNHISHDPDTAYGNPTLQMKKAENIEKELLAYKNVKPCFSIKRKLYRLGHGPTDGRLDRPHEYMKGYHFEEWWNKTAYPYDDIRYGLREAELVDADVTMVVNYGTGTPQEAGRLAGYLNGKNNSLRNSQGEKPWNVGYFELGNEVSWRSERGHDPFCLSASVYARRSKEFAAEIRKNSDIPVQIGLVASINGSFINDDWSNNESGGVMHDIDTLIGIMRDDIDFVVFHNYPSLGFEPQKIMAQNTWLQQRIDSKIRPTIDSATKKYGLSHPVKLANSEFNTGRYGQARNPDVLEALYAADNIILAANNDMEMAVSFCFSSHGFQGMMFFENDTASPTPVFEFQKLLACSMGDSVLAVKTARVPKKTVHGLNTVQETENNTLTHLDVADSLAVDQLAFLASKKNDGTITLLVLNRMEEPQRFKVMINGTEKYSRANVRLLKGETYLSKNFTLAEEKYEPGDLLIIPGTSIAVIEMTNKNLK
jgi:hypothetical protein